MQDLPLTTVFDGCEWGAAPASLGQVRARGISASLSADVVAVREPLSLHYSRKNGRLKIVYRTDYWLPNGLSMVPVVHA